MIRYLNPLQWMKWFGQWLFLWGTSIPWKRASAALPALFLTIALGFLLFVSSGEGVSWRDQLIRQQLADAFQTENYDTAELLVRRQIEEGDQSAETVYRLAVAKHQQDESEEAIGLMRGLVGQQRDDAAAMWLVKELYSGKDWNEFEEPEKREFGQLLKLLNEAKPDDYGIMKGYSDYLVRTQRATQAIPFLIQLSKVDPGSGFLAARIARADGDEESAVRYAEAMLADLRARFKEEPASSQLAMACAQVMLFLEQHKEAVALLNGSVGSMKTAEEQTTLKQAMGELIVSWIEKIQAEPNETADERLRVLQMLQVALQVAPNNQAVLNAVAEQVLQALQNEDEEVKSILKALVKGSSPGIANFILGTAALLRGDSEKAVLHLKLAAEHLPNSSSILNNLAVAMHQMEGTDLEQALKISEQAIASVSPPNVYFFETRGQILLKLGRHLDAIPDLERALSEDKLRKPAHESLAVCFEKLGQDDLAEEHRKAAAEIE